MNGILGMTELLLETSIDQQQHEYLNILRDSSQALLGLMNDMLDFSKIEAGKFTLRPEPFHLVQCIDEAMRVLAIRAHEKGLEILTEIDPDVPVSLIGDSGRLRQIFVNLFSNGIKFTEAGFVHMKVSLLQSTLQQATLHFSVADSGCGITEEQSEKIFAPFEQVDASSSRMQGGTGLGLSICQKLTDMMGGKIWFESNQKGTTFHFHIPLEIDQNSASQSEINIPQGLSVMIIDDHPLSRSHLQIMSQQLGLHTETAVDLRDASEKLQGTSQTYDLIMLSASLLEPEPGNVLQRLMPTTDTHPSLVVILNACDPRDVISRNIQSPISAYLMKPYSYLDLPRIYSMALSLAEDYPLLKNTPEVQKSVRPLRILLAEDSLVNQQVARGILEKRGASNIPG